MISIANPTISQAAKDAVVDVLDSGHLADGPEVRAFEEEFAELCKANEAVATSNGTTALHAALAGLGIGSGDRVLTTPFSFIASANSVRLAGAEPVFADIDPETFNLDPEVARDVASEEDVDAILAVHLYGLPAAMEELAELAADLDVPLIEDAAQAHGASVNGTPVGAIGDVGCFSFYPTKNMTTGEGGMVTTDDAELADRVRQFVDHGRVSGYEHAVLGHNFRMTSIAAAIGRDQLERLDDFTEARRANAARFDAELSGSSVTVPVEPDDRRHVYHQYTIRTEDRDGLRAALEEAGVGSAVYYPSCIHEQAVYADVDASAPAAEQVAEEVLSLPVHPSVTAEDIEHITAEISTYVN